MAREARGLSWWIASRCGRIEVAQRQLMALICARMICKQSMYIMPRFSKWEHPSLS